MATVKENAEQYINKLYDATQDKQKQMLTDAYKVNTEALNTEKQNVQQQTDANLERTNVEAQRVDQQYKPTNVSPAVNQQAALTMENQQKKNIQTLQNQQQTVEAELERVRKVYADQYAAAIKQAQADNDMARAQQLYAAAKAKDAELAGFYSSEGTLDNEALINKIYESAIESGKQGLEMELIGKLSEIYANRQANQRETDANLTQAYVNALRQNQNAAEHQNARGLGSGNVAQSRMARDTAATDTFTELRRAQMAADAGYGVQKAETEKSYADAVADLAKENEQKRLEALYQEMRTRPVPVYEEESSGGGRGGGSGAYVPPDGTGGYGYDDVVRDIENAKINGNYGGSIQSMINAAYKEGYITSSQKKELEKDRNGLIYVG